MDLLSTLIKLSLVMGVFGASMWAIKRYAPGLTGVTAGARTGAVKVVSRVPVGRNASLMVVEFSGQQLLLSVGAQANVLSSTPVDPDATADPSDLLVSTDSPAHDPGTPKPRLLAPASVQAKLADLVARGWTYLLCHAPAWRNQAAARARAAGSVIARPVSRLSGKLGRGASWTTVVTAVPAATPTFADVIGAIDAHMDSYLDTPPAGTSTSSPAGAPTQAAVPAQTSPAPRVARTAPARPAPRTSAPKATSGKAGAPARADSKSKAATAAAPIKTVKATKTVKVAAPRTTPPTKSPRVSS